MSVPAQTVLVLGAGGFIGSHLCAYLAAQGRDVIAASRQSLACAHPSIRNIVSSWDDAAQFAQWLPRCEAVVHAASVSTPASSAAQPQLDGNLRTTLALVEALQDAPACRLLFLSSGGTLYGDRDEAACEHDALRPRSYHGAGKAAAEHFIQAWTAQYGGTAVVLRPSNVYGPGQIAKHGFAIIPTALACAASGTPLVLWGDGGTVRDYLYIDDFADLSALALARPLDAGSHVFNAASGESTSLNALLDQVDATTGMPLERAYLPARKADVRRIAMDNSAAGSAFGWAPRISLPEGLQRTWHWFQARP